MTIAIDRTTEIVPLDISTIAFTAEQFDRGAASGCGRGKCAG